MLDAGFDPHATYRIWRDLIEEDARAEIKREEPGLFTKPTRIRLRARRCSRRGRIQWRGRRRRTT